MPIRDDAWSQNSEGVDVVARDGHELEQPELCSNANAVFNLYESVPSAEPERCGKWPDNTQTLS